MLLCILFAVLTADTVPANVQSWIQACENAQSRAIKRQQTVADIAKNKLKRTAPQDRKKNLEASKKAQADLELIIERPSLFFASQVIMSTKPSIDSIGYIDGCRVIRVLSPTSAIVELENYTFNATGGVNGTTKGRVILTEVDTTKWPNDSGTKIDATFIAFGIDETQNRMISLKPFDVEKWQAVAASKKSPSKK